VIPYFPVVICLSLIDFFTAVFGLDFIQFWWLQHLLHAAAPRLSGTSHQEHAYLHSLHVYVLHHPYMLEYNGLRSVCTELLLLSDAFDQPWMPMIPCSANIMIMWHIIRRKQSWTGPPGHREKSRWAEPQGPVIFWLTGPLPPFNKLTNLRKARIWKFTLVITHQYIINCIMITVSCINHQHP